MIGRKFVVFTKDRDGKDSAVAAEIIDRYEDAYFDEENFHIEESEDPGSNPGIMWNNHKKFISFIFVDILTREVGNCAEFSLMFDITGIDDEQKIKSFIEKGQEIIEQGGEGAAYKAKQTDELEYLYGKYIELGWTHEESVAELKVVVETKFNKKKKK